MLSYKIISTKIKEDWSNWDRNWMLKSNETNIYTLQWWLNNSMSKERKKDKINKYKLWNKWMWAKLVQSTILTEKNRNRKRRYN